MLAFKEKAVVMTLRAPEGDFCDWIDIASWASDIADALLTHAASA